jgi:AcrR family transcriptional regulator
MRLGTSDDSTRVRVRAAAVAVFGRDGLGASLRSIAADAGLTAGRIVQLFGSKEELRRECDEHVFAVIREVKRDAMVRAHGSAATLEHLVMIDEYVPYVAYVARSVHAGGEQARAFIEHMVEDALDYVGDAVAAGTLLPSRDERARVRYLTESSLGHLALRLSLDAPQSAEELRSSMRAHIDDIVLPALELYTQGFLADRRMLDAYLLYVGDPPTSDQAASA